MFDPEYLVWTSQEEVTSVLLTAVQTSPQYAICAMSLCQAIAPLSAAPALLAIARARDQAYWVRLFALRAYSGTGAVVPDQVMESFFAEWFFSIGAPHTYDAAKPGVLKLHELLAVVKTPAHERIAMHRLAMSSPDVRAEALIDNAISYQPPATQTMAWLRDEWLARGGVGNSVETNRSVALTVFPDRQEGLGILLRYWADRPRDTEEFYQDRRRVPGLAAFVLHPSERLRAAAALELPLVELISVLGPRGLRRVVHRAIAARNEQLARENFLPTDRIVADQYHKAVAVLGEWCEGPGVTMGLLRGVALAPAVRAALVGKFQVWNPVQAIEIVAARLDAEDNQPALRGVLEMIAGSGPYPHWATDTSLPPVAGDLAAGPAARSLVSRALRVRDEASRYLAIQAFEAMGDPPPSWRETLRALATGRDPLVRVRASGSLARLGEREAEAQLAQAAVRERRVEVRAEAIRRLSELPSAGNHLELFDHAVAHDDATYGEDGISRPALDQAALALARVGGARAMTLLLRCAFKPLTNAAEAVIRAGLRVGAAEASGSAPLSAEERCRQVAVEERGWLSGWSPLSAYRFSRAGD